MLMRTIVTLAAFLVLCGSNGWANGHKARRHHHHVYVVPDQAQVVVPPAPYGGRLVAHPALNFACMTPYQVTRALPCDQPVWVYGTPCEVDLGLGRYRSCD